MIYNYYDIDAYRNLLLNITMIYFSGTDHLELKSKFEFQKFRELIGMNSKIWKSI